MGTLNVWQVSNLQSLTLGTNVYVPTANVGTLNVSTISNLNSLVLVNNLYASNALTATNVFATTANVGTLNVSTISNLNSLVLVNNLYASNALTATNVFATTANVGTLNVSTISNLNSLILVNNLYASNALTATNVFATTANVITLNVATISNLNSLVLVNNLYASNALTATNVFATTANVGTLNVATISNLNSLVLVNNLYASNALTATNVFATTANVGTLNVATISNLNSLVLVNNLYASNALTATNVFATTANVGTLNAATISNLNSLALVNNLYASNALMATNVFATTANVGTLNVSTISNLNSLALVNNLYASNSITTTNVFITNGLDVGPGTLGTNVVVFSNISGGANVFVMDSNGRVGIGATSPSTQLVVQGVGGDYSGISILKLRSLGTFGTGMQFDGTAGAGGKAVFIWTTNTAAGEGAGKLLFQEGANATTGSLLALDFNKTSVGIGRGLFSPTANLHVAGNIYASNALQTTNVVTSNINVSSTANIANLVVTSNILPGPAGNTYVTGNVVVSGNVYSSLGKLGDGGGYYFSLPGDVALQIPYTGSIYGTTYPLSVGLSNGWTITGTSTLITVTGNGNFQFSKTGVYKLSAVFQGSTDNITGLAVGSNVADIHGTDQGYMYRYTTFLTQNPTELIEIPLNVTDASKYYYLDVWCVDGGALKATATGTGGTYMTITPLQGGGVASGGPGGTPGTQWISSGSNIYYSNSVGIGAVNPAYNLDVSTGTAGVQRLVTSNISSLGLYGPGLNINSNVTITANLAIGGLTGQGPLTPPYALTVYGQGYFSNHVSYQNFAGYRNRMVNGTFRVAARANSITVANTSVFNSNVWFVDRWRIDVGGLSTSNVSFNVKQDAPIGTTNGFTQCANVFVTRALTGTTGNTWVCPMSQTIEASFIFDFRWGQVTAKPAVFSFYANAAVSGDYSVVFRSRQDNTYYANLVSLTAGRWSQSVIYLPACYIGSWAQSSTEGFLDVLIGGVSYGVNGSNNRAVAVTSGWTANPGFAPVSCIGATKWPASTGLVLQITGPQLEEGTIATPFEVRPLTQTYIYCQRFYETNQQTQYTAALLSGRINSVPFTVTKRNNPNVSVYTTQSNLLANTNISTFTSITTGGSYANTAITSYDSSLYGFTFNFTQGTGANKIDEAQFVWQADSEIY